MKKEIEEELEQRIQTIESADYKGAKRFSFRDYVIWGIVVAICLVAVIAGAWLA